MIKNRIALIIWVVVAAGLHVFSNDFGTRVILLASIVVPAIMVTIAGIAARRVSVSLDHAHICKCDESLDILVSARGMGLLPGHIKCRLAYDNLFTGETHEEEILFLASSAKFMYKPQGCGMINIFARQLAITDIFGLSTWKVKHPPASKLLVMPNLVNIHLTVSPSTRPTLDSDDYSMHLSGSDSSETFAIREYIPGDPLKSIHWKLSQKTDKLLVRELGLPISNRILLFMETSVPKPEIKRINRIAITLYSVAHELIIHELTHTLGWMDTKTYEYKSHEITSTQDLELAFADLLANTIKPCDISAIESHNAFGSPSHIVIGGTFVAQHDFDQSAVTIIDGTDIPLEMEI